MKNIIAFLLSCLSVTALLSQAQTETRLQVLRATPGETVLQLEISDLQFTEVQTGSGKAYIPAFDGGTPLLQRGKPDVPKYALSLAIPAKGRMALEVLAVNYQELPLMDIAPSKGNLLRNVDPATVPYLYGSVYENDDFFPNQTAELQETFVFRDVRGQNLWIQPVQYNPVRKLLRVARSVTVRVYQTTEPGDNELRAQTPRRKSRAFEQLYEKVFVNYSQTQSRSGGAEEPERMLVIAADDLIPGLEPFVDWKRQMGIHTTVVPTSDIGSSSASAVYDFIQNYYQTDPVSYLLLVGDENDIFPLMRPSGGNNYSCDNCFGYMEGNDHYPEIMVGRFNAENLAQVQIMAARNLDYEKMPLVDTLNNWTATAMASASDEGAGIGDDNQADWEHANEIKANHLIDGYEKVWEFYDGNHSADSPTPGDQSADLPGNPTNAQLVQLMNGRGVSLYNYTGHGWEQGLVSGNFNTSAVAQLRNTRRYPILIAVACCAGNFTNNGAGDCLGEAWQRAGNAATGEPWGGIAGFFSSDFQSWAPPMEGQDAMNAYLVDSDGLALKPSIGNMAVYGNALMIAAYGPDGELMADFWNPFGDPTTAPRTRAAADIQANHPSDLQIGDSQLVVECQTEGAQASLYWNGQTLAIATVENGTAVLNFPPLDGVGGLILTLSQFNHTPYQDTLQVAPNSGPFMTGLLQAADANANSRLEYGETVYFTLNLQNVGVETANAVSASISVDAPEWVQLKDSLVVLGDFPAGSEQSVGQAFSFQIAENVSNGQKINFTLKIDYSDSLSYTLNWPAVLNAPDLHLPAIFIDDLNGGNGNGLMESGETITIRVQCANKGQSTSPEAFGALTTDSPYLTISPVADLGPLAAGGVGKFALFQVEVSDQTPQVESIHLFFDLQAGQYGASAQFGPYVLNPLIENFETHDFNSFPWEMSGDKPWTITTYQPFRGPYCSRSGVIGHNDKSQMNLTLNVSDSGQISFGRRVSSEEEFDFLRFYIDDVEVAAWSGILPWEEVSFPVEPGVHKFTWSYEKDEIGNGGSDRAWVDEISLPPHQIVVETVAVGTDPEAFTVFPNPTTGVLHLVTASPIGALAVYDLQGRRLLDYRDGVPAAERSGYRLDLGTLPDGVYVLKYYDGERWSARKIVKQ